MRQRRFCAHPPSSCWRWHRRRRPFPPAPRPQEAAFDRAAITRALDAVRADPQLSAEKTMKTLRWRDATPAGSRGEDLDGSPGLPACLRWLGQSGRYLVWVSAAILAVLAARYVLETATRARLASAERRTADRAHARARSRYPAGQPACRTSAPRRARLWDGGQQRAALALLYRGLLSRLAHVHSVPIRDSTTEGDCLALAAAHLATPRHDYVVAARSSSGSTRSTGTKTSVPLRFTISATASPTALGSPRLVCARSERHRREQGPCLDRGSGGRVSRSSTGSRATPSGPR